MIDLLLAILLAFAHPSNYPHVAVYVLAGHRINITTANMGVYRVWDVAPPAGGIEIILRCGDGVFISECRKGDVDCDGDVDLFDFALFQRREWTGPKEAGNG